jgi:hypothetical protein
VFVDLTDSLTISFRTCVVCKIDGLGGAVATVMKKLPSALPNDSMPRQLKRCRNVNTEGRLVKQMAYCSVEVVQIGDVGESK